MALHQRYNNENIFSRAIIAGVLNILNNKITYEQVWSNEDIETIEIPWFYNMSGDERFMQDFYTFYAHCLPPKPIDGNFDRIPRGVITYTGSAIDPARITSRYVQGHYLKEVDGQLQTFRSFLYSIPLTVNFNCEMWIDTQITALKVEQIIREVFYKTITFYVYYKGMRVGSTIGFPEDYTIEKNIDYSFESNNKIKLTFTLSVETYQPVFDPTTEVDANQYMTGVGYRLVVKPASKHDGIITITTPLNPSGDLILPKGYPLLIEWDYKDENAIINRVDVLWSDTGSNVRNVIEKGVPNNEFYVWNIPDDFTNFEQPVILWPNDSSISVYREPIVKIVPDVSTNEISESSFAIIDPGYFMSYSLDASFPLVLEMRDTNDQLVYTEDASIICYLSGNTLASVSLPDGPIVFPGDIAYKEIDIYIVNSVIGSDKTVNITPEEQPFDVVRNVIIV